MESRRFPRVNSLKPASPDDPEGKRSNGISGKADGRQAGTTRAGNLPSPVDLGGNESPAWQDYFFLAPNVRFTRTPDYEASTRPREQGDAGQNEQPAQPASQATARAIAPSHPDLPAPTSDRNPALPAARPSAGSAAHAHGNARQPASPGHPGDKARAGTAAVARTPAAPTQETAASVRSASRGNARWPYLSDHVFFELMAPYMIESQLPAPQAVPRPAAPAVALSHRHHLHAVVPRRWRRVDRSHRRLPRGRH